MNKLRTQLTLTYIVISMIIVALISIMANISLDRIFRRYVTNIQESKSTEIIKQITERYNSFSNTWSYDVLDNIGINALCNSFIIKVKAEDGSILWNAWEHNGGECSSMLQNIAENMFSRYPDFKGAYMEDSYEITVNKKNVGYVDIGYYGPFYYTDNDLAFINAFNTMLTAVGIVSFVIAVILGLFTSMWLTRPISKVVHVTGQIAKGNLSERVLIKSKTKEIKEMANAINNLGETLENVEGLRKRLTADIAHELRTPLFTLQSHIEAMIEGIWKPDTKRLQSCHDEIMRLNRMVGDLKKLSEFESESLTLNKQEFYLCNLMEGILSNFEAEFSKKEINLSFENSFNGKIFADKDKISQIIVNIVANALKYTNKGGIVNIKLESDYDTAIIIIKDSGIGIAEGDLPFLFERFYRTDKSRSKSTGGSGIGLTIVKSLVLAHEGSLSVESEPGTGSVFTVSLPVKP